MLKTEQAITVSANELEKFLKEKGFDIGDSAAAFFWPEDFMNDCYKTLCLDCGDTEYEINEETLSYMTLEDIEEDNARIRLENAILQAIREEVGVDEILVDVSW